jgi:addiction module HigA family antidote
MSVNALAHALRVPATRLHEIVKERRAITPDTALRLARYFGGDAQSWLNLQACFDLKTAELRLRDVIEREVEPAYSGPIRPPILIESGHPFWFKPATDSG